MEENTEKVMASDVQKQGKMSYEQLEDVAHQLSEQARQLYNKLLDTNMENAFKRLDYLFKIMEYASRFDKEFVDKCVTEIVAIMTIPEESEDKSKE